MSIFFDKPPVCDPKQKEPKGPFVQFKEHVETTERLLEDFKQLWLDQPGAILFEYASRLYNAVQKEVDYYRCKFNQSARSLDHIAKLHSEFYHEDLEEKLVKKQAIQFPDGDIVYTCEYMEGKFYPTYEKGLCLYNMENNKQTILVKDKEFSQIAYSPVDNMLVAVTDTGFLRLIGNKIADDAGFDCSYVKRVYPAIEITEVVNMSGKIYVNSEGSRKSRKIEAGDIHLIKGRFSASGFDY